MDRRSNSIRLKGTELQPIVPFRYAESQLPNAHLRLANQDTRAMFMSNFNISSAASKDATFRCLASATYTHGHKRRRTDIPSGIDQVQLLGRHLAIHETLRSSSSVLYGC